MANKPVPENRKAKSAGISLPPQITTSARKLAYSKGLSLSAFVRSLLIKEMEAAK
jgi:hypothetical protein